MSFDPKGALLGNCCTAGCGTSCWTGRMHASALAAGTSAPSIKQVGWVPALAGLRNQTWGTQLACNEHLFVGHVPRSSKGMRYELLKHRANGPEKST